MSQAPYPSLRVRFVASGVAGYANAIVDTGFDGYLVVPESLIGTLPEPRYYRRYRTASGESVVTVAYDGFVELVDQPGPIAARIIALGDEYLVGIQTLNHFRVTLDRGQHVILEPRPKTKLAGLESPSGPANQVPKVPC